MTVELTMPDGNVRTESLVLGDILRIPVPVGQVVEAKIDPGRGLDVGAGPGHDLTAKLEGGEAGILLDGRGRPIAIPAEREAATKLLLKWFTNLQAYPEDALQRYTEAS